MKNIFIRIFLLFILTANSTILLKGQINESLNQVSTDAQGNSMLVGKCTKAGLEKAPFNMWFDANYSAYQIDSFTCNFIRPLLSGKSITIFLGTWCGDSRREVPRIIKILECCDFPQNMLSLVMVSNVGAEYKKSPTHEEAGRNIVRVPTIIIEENGSEIGRIIEFPIISMEKDLLAILKKENYKPNYNDARIIAK